MDQDTVSGSMGTPPDADPATQREVGNLVNEYDAAREFDRPARKKYDRDRKFAAGISEWAVDANLLGALIDILVAYLYARDPDVSVRPSERVEMPVDPLMGIEHPAQTQADMDREAFAKTLQIVISRTWRQGKLKKAVKRQVRSALTVSVGWFKALMYTDEIKKPDPVLQTQINDMRDNISRYQALVERAEDPDSQLDSEELQVNLREQERHLETLQERVEVFLRKYMAIDFISADDVQVSLDVPYLEDYTDANWIAVQMFKPKDELDRLFPALTRDDVASATGYQQRKPAGGETYEQPGFTDDKPRYEQGTGDGKGVEFVRIIEFWDHRDNMIKTVVEGVNKWAREPFAPRYASTRFYPFFMLAFYPSDNERHPQSLPHRLHKLQEEYASARSNWRLTRQRSIPGVIFNAGRVKSTDIDKIKNSEQAEFTGIEPTDPSQPLDQIFMEKPTPKIDPQLFVTEPIVRDMEKLSGVQEAQQASITKVKTAYEASIQQSGFAARSSTDRDAVDDMLSDFAQYTAEVVLQCLTREDVQRMAGAAAFWPEDLPLDDLLTMVETDIQAGSTGRPNTESERETWVKILPVLRQTMSDIQTALATGNTEMSRALTELLRETMNRFSDRIDVDRFIPKIPGMPIPGDVPAAGGGEEGGEEPPNADPTRQPPPGESPDLDPPQP